MKKKEEDCRSNPTRSPTDHESHSHHSSSPPPFFHQIPNQSTSPTDFQFGVSAATTEDHHLKHEQIEEEEEEGNNKGFNQNLLRLGRPIPTSSPTDQESSIIMLSDSAVLSTSPTDYTSPTDLQFGVSPATTEDHHLKHEQIEEEEGNNKGFNQNEEVSDDEGSVSDRSSLALSASPENADPSARTTIQPQTSLLDLPVSLINQILLKLPQYEAMVFPFISNSMMNVFFEDPSVVVGVVRSWQPMHVVIDCGLLRPTSIYSRLFVKGLVEFHRASIICLDLKGCTMRLTNTFMALKIVRLCRVRLFSVDGLIAHSPVLEELYLEKSIVPARFSIDYEGPSLRSLTMDTCHTDGGGGELGLEHLYIRHPDLVQFTFTGSIVSHSFDVICPSLHEASLNFMVHGYLDWQPSFVHPLLKRMRSSVEKLHICNFCLENIRDEGEKQIPQPPQPSITPFTSLEELHIDDIVDGGLRELPYVLPSLPVLKKLYIKFFDLQQQLEEPPHANQWETPPFESLLYLEFTAFRCHRREVQLLSFLLGNSPRLLKTKIVMSSLGTGFGVTLFGLRRLRVAFQNTIAEIRNAYQLVEIELEEE